MAVEKGSAMAVGRGSDTVVMMVDNRLPAFFDSSTR
jgi:hypothetical protein